MKFDLHCHSDASDGSCSASSLLVMAEAADLDLLAITDHDNIDGYLEISTLDSSVRVLSGIEFSACWKTMGVHIVGIGFDPTHPTFVEALQKQRLVRQQRAKIISKKLEGKGISGAYLGALSYCDDKPEKLGRPHFAQFLVAKGHVKDHQTAFKRWLGQGKCGDIRALWPPVEEVLSWILAAGGVGILAHPLQYKMTATKLKRLISDFKLAGGQSIEVISAGQNPDNTRHLEKLCNEFDLFASGGSDFHQPSTPRCQLGQVQPLPKSCKPVWQLLSL